VVVDVVVVVVVLVVVLVVVVVVGPLVVVVGTHGMTSVSQPSCDSRAGLEQTQPPEQWLAIISQPPSPSPRCLQPLPHGSGVVVKLAPLHGRVQGTFS
jgi:hypothetical protein